MAIEDFFTGLNSSTDPNAIYQQIANILHIPLGVLFIILVIVSIWSLVWKGLALWKSARKNQMIWFIVLLIFNTVGILDILYIYIFSKMGSKKEPSSQATKKKKR